MTVSNSVGSYQDCYEVFDRAIQDPKGIRVGFSNIDRAIHFRMRCHYARRLDRDHSRVVYEAGDPKYGISQYDAITIRARIVDGKAYLYFERTDKAVPTDIESLSETVEEAAMPPTPGDDFASTPTVTESLRRV